MNKHSPKHFFVVFSQSYFDPFHLPHPEVVAAAMDVRSRIGKSNLSFLLAGAHPESLMNHVWDRVFDGLVDIVEQSVLSDRSHSIITNANGAGFVFVSPDAGSVTEAALPSLQGLCRSLEAEPSKHLILWKITQGHNALLQKVRQSANAQDCDPGH